MYTIHCVLPIEEGGNGEEVHRTSEPVKIQCEEASGKGRGEEAAC